MFQFRANRNLFNMFINVTFFTYSGNIFFLKKPFKWIWVLSKCPIWGPKTVFPNYSLMSTLFTYGGLSLNFKMFLRVDSKKKVYKVLDQIWWKSAPFWCQNFFLRYLLLSLLFTCGAKCQKILRADSKNKANRHFGPW